MTTRAAIVAEARSWVDTPYQHQGSVKGVACDCVGLLRGVFSAVMGRELVVPAAYTRDWAETTGEETFLDGARAQLVEVDKDAARAGDLLLFRWRPNLPVKHCAFLVEGDLGDNPARIVHAYDAARFVKEVNLEKWRPRVVAAFTFPGVEDE